MADQRKKDAKQGLAVGLSFLLIAASSYGYRNPEPVPETGAGGAAVGAQMSTSELEALVAPIALYPDALVAQILAAATFPDQVAIADYWLHQNQNLTGSSLMHAVDKQSWDSSVKALSEFPSVLDNLAKNLTWTSSLGEAYHNQPADVMAAIQTLRAKAKAAGNLKSSSQITVVQQTPQTILIQPANPQVVYVPEYNPAVVYGTPYVTPGYTVTDAAAAGVIGFGAGIAIGALAGGGCCGWGWNSWNCDWHGGAMVYNHNNFYGNAAWHGGYNNGGYHNGYGYHNAYNRTTVNNFAGSAKRVNNFNREGDRNIPADRADSWAHDESSFGRSNAFSGLGDRFGGFGGWSSRADSFRGWGSMRAGGFGGGRFGGGGFGRGHFGGFRGFRRKAAAMGRILMSHLASKHKVLVFTLLISLASCNKPAQPVKATAEKVVPEKVVPRTFASPSEAGAALSAAAESGDRTALLAIFGPDGEEILFTGDPVRDKASLEDFVTAYKRMNRWGKIKAGGQTLYIGPDNYPFPVPLGQNPSGQWYFDTAAGKDEILARRIGKNELTAIAACEATADSQKRYFSQTHDGGGVKQYAQKFVSDSGKQNGLYWPATEGRPSPLGEFGDFGKVVASNTGDQPPLFNGYYYRILTRPSDLVNGRMRDFAILAYPAEYRNSGIMTFIVGKDGAVYQKDLGEKTGEIALAMTDFNLADGWSPVVPHADNGLRAQR